MKSLVFGNFIISVRLVKTTEQLELQLVWIQQALVAFNIVYLKHR